jgi:MFS family permease
MKKSIPRNVFFLGLVSFLTDVSSEMIYPLIPLFLKGVLGASASIIGVIEGIAESTASLLKVVSGTISDRILKRKPLVTFGYTLSTLAKPTVGFATHWLHVLLARFGDRVGKGIRTSPRDALISESTDKGSRGIAFGFHRTLDTLGAITGPSIAILILKFKPDGYRLVFFLSFLPGFLAILLLIFFVKERIKQREMEKTAKPSPLQLPRSFWIFLISVIIFSLGNSSDAFVILRARNLGFKALSVTGLYLLFNIVYAFSATPLGALSDKWGRKRVIIAGWLTYSFVYFSLAFIKSTYFLPILFALYGLYYGFTEGVLRAMVADFVPENLRGTAYGVFHTSVGLSLLPASIAAGYLWDRLSPSSPFLLGGVMALIATITLYTTSLFSKGKS